MLRCFARFGALARYAWAKRERPLVARFTDSAAAVDGAGTGRVEKGFPTKIVLVVQSYAKYAVLVNSSSEMRVTHQMIILDK